MNTWVPARAVKRVMETTVMTLSIEQLVQAHHAGVWRYLRVLGCTREQADDLTQETFLVVIRKGFEEIDPAATAAYLRKSARYLWLDSCRNTATRREVDLDGAEAVMKQFDHDGGNTWVDALRRCIDRLHGKTRAAVVGVYRDQRPQAEVAQALGLAPNGLKTLLQRARGALRTCVETRLEQARTTGAPK